MLALFLYLNKRIFSIFTVNYLENFMTNLRSNIVRKNDVTLP